MAKKHKSKWRTWEVPYEAYTVESEGEVLVKARTEEEAMKKAEEKLQDKFEHVEIWYATEHSA